MKIRLAIKIFAHTSTQRSRHQKHWKRFNCSDFETDEESKAQNLENQRYGWDKAAGIALETRHVVAVTEARQLCRLNFVASKEAGQLYDLKWRGATFA